jgi:hypothetical protein
MRTALHPNPQNHTRAYVYYSPTLYEIKRVRSSPPFLQPQSARLWLPLPPSCCGSTPAHGAKASGKHYGKAVCNVATGKRLARRSGLRYLRAVRP